MDYINKPIGQAKTPPGALKPLIADPDHGGHRLRVDGDVRPRRPVDEGEDRDQPLAPAAHAGRHRPAAHDVAAAGGHRGVGDGHRLPRRRELHREVLHALRPQEARGAGHLLRLEPGLRPVVREVDGPHRDVVPDVGARGLDSSAGRHADGGDVRGHGLRQRRACTSRTPTPTRSRAWYGLPARGLPAGRADGAARAVGVADGARGVPVLLRERARAAPARGRPARPGRAAS